MKIYHISLILLIFALSGCMGLEKIGSNIDSETVSDMKGKEKLDATMEESRKSSSPQAITINVSSSGNSRSQVDIKEPSPKMDDVKLGKSMRSDSMFDQSVTELYSQHSGLFYLFLGAGLLIIVYAWKKLESTVTFKAAAPLGAVAGHLTRKLMEIDRGDPKHTAYSDILREIESREKDIKDRKGRA